MHYFAVPCITLTIYLWQKYYYLQRGNSIGVPFYELGEVDSTNNYAMRMVQAHLAEHGATWLASYQNAGKGQRGKPWHAAPFENITMTCLMDTTALSIDNQFILSAAVAVACRSLIARHSGETIFIKWPNDIYWKDRKAGGILIENVIQGKVWRFALAGMGLNINQAYFDETLPNPVSLAQITGKNYDVVELAKELCTLLNSWWNIIKAGDYQYVLRTYELHLYKLGSPVLLSSGDEAFEATIKGVNEKGELIVNSPNYQKISRGSVRWL